LATFAVGTGDLHINNLSRSVGRHGTDWLEFVRCDLYSIHLGKTSVYARLTPAPFEAAVLTIKGFTPTG
jgi:hypothetical protein